MKRMIAGLALALCGPAALAQSPPLAYGPPIRFEAARTLIDRAIVAAKAGGYRMAVAVVEPSGELVAFVRMDDTQYGSIRVAQKKATTAARYREATSELEKRVLAGRTVSLANDDSLPIAGGLPIVIDGKIVGAIGVSGATAAEDDGVARRAIAPIP
jgi:glc operon protein GlcG